MKPVLRIALLICWLLLLVGVSSGFETGVISVSQGMTLHSGSSALTLANGTQSSAPFIVEQEKAEASLASRLDSPLPQLHAAAASQQGVVAVRDLSVSPFTPKAGDRVLITFTVYNPGTAPASYSLEVEVDGESEAVKSGELPPGASREHRHTTLRTEPETYVITVSDMATTFSVPPSRISFAPLVISPRIAQPGTPVTVQSRVSNEGGHPERYEASLLVGGQLEQVIEGKLPAGASAPISFLVTRQLPGTYAVSFGGQTGTFVVAAPAVSLKLSREVPVSDSSAIALDNNGNVVEVRDGFLALRDGELGEAEVELPLVLEEGRELRDFFDPTTGVQLRAGVLEVPIRERRRLLYTYVAHVDSFRGVGNTATAVVEALELRLPSTLVDLGLVDKALEQVEFTINTRFTQALPGPNLELTISGGLSWEEAAVLSKTAEEQGFAVTGVGPVFNVSSLDFWGSRKSVETKVRVALAPEWITGHGGPGQMRWLVEGLEGGLFLAKADFVAEDSVGRMVFDASLPEGFASLALVGVADALPSEQVAIEGLEITPMVVAPDEGVGVIVSVTNRASREGFVDVILSIDGNPRASQVLRLQPGEARRVLFPWSFEEPATYSIAVGGLQGRLVVARPIAVEQRRVDGLQVVPPRPRPGDRVTVTAQVANRGQELRSWGVELYVNSVLSQVQPVALAPGETASVEFHLVKRVPGPYSVQVGPLRGGFEMVEAISSAFFVATELRVEPESVDPGEPATVTFLLTNAGGEAGTFSQGVEIDGTVEALEPVFLEPHTTVPMRLTVLRKEPGAYTVRVGGAEARFTVREVLKPDIVVEDLRLTPRKVQPNTAVQVIARLANVGDVAGFYRLTLKVDDTVERVIDIRVPPGTSKEVQFIVSATEPGDHSVEVDGFAAVFVVGKPFPLRLLLGSLLGGGAFIVALAGFFVWWRSRRRRSRRSRRRTAR